MLPSFHGHSMFALPAPGRAAQLLLGCFWVGVAVVKSIHGDSDPNFGWSTLLHSFAVALEAALGLGLLFDGRQGWVKLAILWPLVLFLYAFAVEHLDPAHACNCLGAGRVDFGWRCVLLGTLLLLAAGATLRIERKFSAATDQGEP